jgi:hypothetical protein
LGGVLLIYVLLARLIVSEVPGFTFTASVITIFAGAQMFMLGIIGEYLARMHFRLMDKPTYVIREETSHIKNRVFHSPLDNTEIMPQLPEMKKTAQTEDATEVLPRLPDIERPSQHD